MLIGLWRHADCEVDTPEVDYSQGPIMVDTEGESEPLPGDWQLSDPPSWAARLSQRHDIPPPPRHLHRDLPVFDWDDEDESLSEEEENDYYDVLEDEMWGLDWEDGFDGGAELPLSAPTPCASQGAGAAVSTQLPAHFNSLRLFDLSPSSHHDSSSWEGRHGDDSSDDDLDSDDPFDGNGCDETRDEPAVATLGPQSLRPDLDTEEEAFREEDEQAMDEELPEDEDDFATMANRLWQTDLDGSQDPPGGSLEVDSHPTFSTQRSFIDHPRVAAVSDAGSDLESDMGEDFELTADDRKGLVDRGNWLPTTASATLSSGSGHPGPSHPPSMVASAPVTDSSDGREEYGYQHYSVDSLDVDELDIVDAIEDDLDGDSSDLDRRDDIQDLHHPREPGELEGDSPNLTNHAIAFHHNSPAVAVPFDDTHLADAEPFDDCDEPLEANDDLLDDDDGYDGLLDRPEEYHGNQLDEGAEVDQRLAPQWAPQPAIAEPPWPGYLPPPDHYEDDEEIWDDELM